MVSTIHSRAHQVDCAGIDADVLLVGVLLVDGLGNQTAVRSKHETAKLGVDGYIAHAGRYQDFLVNLAYAFADRHNVVRLLVRTVRNADSTGKVDEGDVGAGLFFQLNSKLEENLC